MTATVFLFPPPDRGFCCELSFFFVNNSRLFILKKKEAGLFYSLFLLLGLNRLHKTAQNVVVKVYLPTAEVW